MTAQTAAATQEETIELPEFTVSTSKDVGYRAGNSVSATRIDTPIKDLPFTISAFTEQFISDTASDDLQDVLRFAPGVTSGDKSFVAGNNRFSIRGFDGDTPPQRNGFTGTRNTDNANVTRIEVIKGPASLLYGQIVPGGVVNYITKRPEAKRAISFSQSYGSDDNYRSVLDVNLPIGSKIGTRFVFLYNQDPQWADGGRTQTWMFAPSLSVKLGEKTKLVVDFEKLRRSERAQTTMLPNVQIAGLGNVAPTSATKPTGPNTTAGLVNPSARAYAQGLYDIGINLGFLGSIPVSKTFSYSNDNDWRKTVYTTFDVELSTQIGDHWVARGNYSFTSREAYHKQTGLGQWDVLPSMAYQANDKTLFDYLAEYQANPEATLADRSKTTSATLSRRKRIQTTLDGYNTYQIDFSGKYKWNVLGGIEIKPLTGVYLQTGRTGGGLSADSGSGYTGSYSDTVVTLNFQPWDYFDQSTFVKSGDYDALSLPAAKNSPASSITRTIEEAVYGVLNVSLFKERLLLIGGVRHDKYRSGGSSPSAAYTFNQRKDTPQVGIGVKVTKDMLIFSNYSKSFLVDGTTLTLENPNYDQTIAANSTTNPTTLKTLAKPTTGLGYEIGIKTDFMAGRISSTVTAFHLERSDRIVTVRQAIPLNTGSFSDVTFSKQGTTDQSRGVEAEITYSPLDNWQLYATYTKMNIKTTKVTAPTARATTDAKASIDYAAYLQGYNDALSLLQGAVPEGSAEMLYSFWTRYTFKGGMLDGFYVAGGFNHTSPKAQRTANPALFIDSYTLFDASAGYSWKMWNAKWNASLNLKNIADTEYTPSNQSRGKPRQIIASTSVTF